MATDRHVKEINAVNHDDLGNLGFTLKIELRETQRD
jgi:hypothetical protein